MFADSSVSEMNDSVLNLKQSHKIRLNPVQDLRVLLQTLTPLHLP